MSLRSFSSTPVSYLAVVDILACPRIQWVGRELKRTEREARMAGGHVLARRLNRSEYANTIRDLLYLDQNFMDLIEEELPGDGKAGLTPENCTIVN